jgi:hypothetical protein
MTSRSKISCTEYLIYDVSENIGLVISRLLIPMMATVIFAETLENVQFIWDIPDTQNTLNSRIENLNTNIPEFIYFNSIINLIPAY